ncbi:Phosphoribosylformylglycinamidine cyclo-ligase [Seminavis robusta]|uniref:Phosphoribosylformylglycinamidine cyclo-ligase n=1 Tax=Seminavis robusta TaxID=568900 RepID=A0A9N8H763_9STRA|nr:Phosphoribosylformylglycinamidine cyclo-ligase [Seminavis robusta]|eukprot:Sro120_g058440.1 Phosphoribosylformylglycinamidine cyclo-ligase (1141) ;mRNA; f:41229-45081
MATATVLGFGARAPPKVLNLLAKTVADNGTATIIPKRSQSISLALCEAPYRTFLTTTPQESNKTPAKNLILYCLPTGVAEYVATDEAATVRSSILSTTTTTNTVVAVYSVETDQLLGGDETALLAAIRGDDGASAFGKAALLALAKLDTMAADQLMISAENKDVVIVVGSGGREHALAVAVAKSPLVGKVICCPGNGGTQVEGGKITNAEGVNGKQDNATVIDLVKRTSAKMVVVGPEAPLVAGLVDELAVACPDVMVFGPSKAAAELEASKAFTKDFLQEHDIPTAKYKNFTSADEAIAYVESLEESDRQVVKASGLAAGKGVLLPTNKAETIAAVKEIMSDKAFGAAGDTCVIESFLTGPEASCFALCDGKTAVLMPAAQDHKRALDNDQGLNTGGMGAYAPAPCVTPNLQQEIEAMCVKTVEKMAERGTPYVGLLYAGMILTPNGPYMLEYNCRFGDPETEVVLPLLETDLYEVFKACCTGTLGSIDVRFKENTCAATVVCAAKGYPEKYPKGMKIEDIAAANACSGVKVYHAGTKIDDSGATLCSGGRVVTVTGMGDSLQAALNASYKGVSKLAFLDGSGQSLMHFRTDIGKKAVEKKLRIGVLGSTRGTALIPVIEACANGSINAEIVAVLSNKSTAPILDKGRALGVTVSTKFVSAKGLSRDQYDAECTASLVKAGVEFVLLVGYMRILSKPFTDFWKGRCINVHPSLLPKHAGGMDLQVHQAVLDAGEKETGCTIHQVTEEVDGGPIVVQKVVQVDEGETAESLKAKVQAQEGLAFIEAIETVCRGGVITYADAGVNIDEGNRLVELIKPLCKSTRRSGCDADLGGFGGLFDLAAAGYNTSDTVIIGATDGVGTKLRIAHATKKHETVGIDLVAMCVNDLIVAGGEPLFFLDYFATGRLEVEEAAAVVKGIAEGCRQAQCGLIGGETAEMPSMYSDGEYDLAGFSVGAVHRDRILPKGVAEGDVLLGLSSSGIHSNGFSLVRKLIANEGLDFSSACPWDPDSVSIGDSLLTPTKIYVKSCLPLIKDGLLKGLAHITGGGLLENLPRSLPSELGAEITGHPPLPQVFKWMKIASGLDDSEMLRTFNCGVGMVLILDEKSVSTATELLKSAGETDVFRLGTVVKGSKVTVTASLT